MRSELATIPLRGPSGEPIDFRRLLSSHGVASLAPNRVDERAWTLETTLEIAGRPRGVLLSEAPAGSVTVTVDGHLGAAASGELLATVRRMLSLDEDLAPFYARAARDRALAWAASGAGRMLRSPTVFEDVVKTICTTNCAWSATVRMTEAIVAGLGPSAGDGRHAFPTAAAMAQAPAGFYEEVARAGYRGRYLRSLAAAVAEGVIDLEALRDPSLEDAEVERRLLALPGVGPYAAAHVMLTSLGRHGRLILDSWTRPAYARLAGRALDDAAIRRRFARYGRYAGLAFWLRVTEHWVSS